MVRKSRKCSRSSIKIGRTTIKESGPGSIIIRAGCNHRRSRK